MSLEHDTHVIIEIFQRSLMFMHLIEHNSAMPLDKIGIVWPHTHAIFEIPHAVQCNRRAGRTGDLVLKSSDALQALCGLPEKVSTG